MKYIETTVKYLNIIKNLYNKQKENKRALFFRGHNKEDYKLLPSIMRILDEHEEMNNRTEGTILLDYRSQLPRTVPHKQFDFVKDRLEILVEMQHYHVPTRLLDWTMNPLIALYFAVKKSDSQDDAKSDACVWVFDAWEHINSLYSNYKDRHPNWREIAILGRALLSDRDKTTITNDLKNIFNIQEDETIKSTIQGLKAPMGLVAPYQNSRMIHQASCFTVLGTEDKSLEESETVTKKHLQKFIIPACKKEAILEELNMFFINEYTVFPDFEGMSKQIKTKKGLYKW